MKHRIIKFIFLFLLILTFNCFLHARLIDDLIIPCAMDFV